MRHVVKQDAPDAYTEWRKVPTSTSWEALRTPEKKIVKEALLREQHFLCAYTEHGIDEDSSHIDHVLPRSISPALLLDYSNLLAAYPLNQGDLRVDGQTLVLYGAHYRQNTILQVTPLHDDCAAHFQFLPSGRVRGTSLDGQSTIDALNLNAGRLVELRRAAIDGAIEATIRGVGISVDVVGGRLPEFVSSVSTLLAGRA